LWPRLYYGLRGRLPQAKQFKTDSGDKDRVKDRAVVKPDAAAAVDSQRDHPNRLHGGRMVIHN
jgi:hypothetical protein